MAMTATASLGADPSSSSASSANNGDASPRERNCPRYRPAACQAQMIDTSRSHLGFRCIRRPETSG
jgi:formylglycine-generating enzyme required for sulfatase activity